ncbi:MAG: CPBP family intramembrane metalloprotease [Lachnospiraceae bacterium]|nr:CPBP family intramembrane metalloprotease [Lachnospiraceae bacterium]
MFLSELVSSILQIIVFSLVPFIWWLVTARKKENFFTWLGFRKITDVKFWKLSLMIAGTIAAFCILGKWCLYCVRNADTAASAFEHGGVSVIPAVLVYAILHTSLSEEILFRGFLLKRIQNKFGFMAGNMIQSLLFGLIHGIGFFTQVGILSAVLIVLFTGGIAFVMGYINEKVANGSVFPSWIIHALTNIISGLMIALW